MSKAILTVLVRMEAMAFWPMASQITEVGWHSDNVRPSRPKPSSKSKSTHKQNARKARKGQP